MVGEGGGVKGSKVKLTKNWLILGQIYSTLFYSSSLPLSPNGLLRLCLFWVKIISRNAFPEMRLFGWSVKFYFPEIEIRWPKKTAFDHGNAFTLLFSLQSISGKWERERERERTRVRERRRSRRDRELQLQSEIASSSPSSSSSPRRDRDLVKKARSRSRSPIAITAWSSLMILCIFWVVACVFWFVFSFFFSKHQTPENIFRKIF